MTTSIPCKLFNMKSKLVGEVHVVGYEREPHLLVWQGRYFILIEGHREGSSNGTLWHLYDEWLPVQLGDSQVMAHG